MLQYKACDVGSENVAVQARGSKVDAGKDAGIIHFQDSPREAGELSPDARHSFGIDPEGRFVAECAWDHP
jgi:hypothetical protein